MNASLPDFLMQLGLDSTADERAIKRAYARQLKQIDQETQPAIFQSLRTAYDAALQWVAVRTEGDAHTPDDVPAGGFPSEEAWVQTETSEAVAAPASVIQARDEYRRTAEHNARACLDALMERLSTAPCTDQAQARALIDAALDHESLIDMDARFLYEWGLTSVLANGWRPGQEHLFGAAMACFDWREDRGRLRALGHPGFIVDNAIAELELYDERPNKVRTAQRDLIRRLRDDRRPRASVLIRELPRLERLAVVYPHWLHIITNTANIARWQAWHREIPGWRRWLAPRPNRSEARTKTLIGGPRFFWIIGAMVLAGAVANLSSPRSGAVRPTAGSSTPTSPSPIESNRTRGDGASLTPDTSSGLGSVPQYVRQPIPVYPASAKRAGLQGRVVVRTMINADGTVRSAQIDQTSGHQILDDAAISAVRQALFVAARDLSGKPVTAVFRLPFNFVLSASPASTASPPRNYGEAIRNAVLPNVVFGAPISGNPAAEVTLHLGADGRILRRELTHSSGVKDWDAAVLRAVDRTVRLPADTDGKVPPALVISFRPKP